MCGVVGIVQTELKQAQGEAVLASLLERLVHRGPDDCGVWLDTKTGVGLGHRRLSIIDLGPTGHQPMISPSGRFVMTYNGEVYNFAELRRTLLNEGYKFRGGSDTEVILAAFERWGIEGAVGKFVGMFAFGVWDRDAKMLYLVRDRLGIKPLYFGWVGRAFVFSSELKPFRALTGFTGEVNRDALALFLRHNCVPGHRSIYQGIHKLLPGCILAATRESLGKPDGFSPDPDDATATWRPTRYWSALQVAFDGRSRSFEGNDEEAISELDRLLRESVRLRMLSDVPLGAFLSGGIDSSTVVALMQAQSARPVRTFTIGFSDRSFNEADYAQRIANHLGTEHTELYVEPQEALDVIPTLATLYDEPFADSSQIPVALVCRLARRHVKVALSGDGGDEAFAGYDRYSWTRSIWAQSSWLPRLVRQSAAKLVGSVSSRTLGVLARHAVPHLTGRAATQETTDQVYRVAEALTSGDQQEMYSSLMSHWKDPASMVHGARELPTMFTDYASLTRLSHSLDRMMYLDTVTYLPDDLLVKLDRASMGVSLEARTPLLDHRVVEFGWRLPTSLKIRQGQNKWVLRRLLQRYLPVELFDRPKKGFGVPLASWLRGPLRGWAEALLDESRLHREGYFDPVRIREKWDEHLAGTRNWHFHLWDVLMFQAWLEQSRKRA